LAAVLVILAVLLLWRLFDLFKGDGLWKKEFEYPELNVVRTSPSLLTAREQEVKNE